MCVHEEKNVFIEKEKVHRKIEEENEKQQKNRQTERQIERARVSE